MRPASMFLAALLAFAAGAPAHAQSRPRPLDQVPIDALVSETQKTSPSPERVALVWWLPPEFWTVTLSQSADMPDGMAAEVGELFGKYVVVAAVTGKIGNFGIDSFDSESELRAKLQLVAPDGTVHRPLPADDLDPRLEVMVGVLKPMFKNVLGEMGKNLNFFAFPGVGEDGARLVDPLGTGVMKVVLAEQAYSFRLPLDSLLVPMQDPRTSEQFPGSFRFNPYTGDPLQVAAGN